MQVRVFRIGGGSRLAGIATAVAVLGIGALLMAFGLVLLAALAAVGMVAGTGALLLRALRGGRPTATPTALDGWRAPLDPALEVRADGGAAAPRELPPGDAG